MLLMLAMLELMSWPFGSLAILAGRFQAGAEA
jgi:hypothetical protein